MANNLYHDPNYNFPPAHARGQGDMAAYLLGMAPMPPPQPQDLAVAMVNHALDHPLAAPNNDENENNNLQLPGPVNTQAQAPVANNQVVVRVAVNDRLTRDIDFPSDIPRPDFRDRVIAAMNLDAATAQLGWKTSDEGKRAPAHQLSTNSDIDNAFQTIIDIQNNPRRKKGVVMEIVHLNPVVPLQAAKKNDGNRASDFAYNEELNIVKEKLKCAQHSGPNRWCYVSPNNPGEHVALGYEEITLWARKIHDNDADADCITPPHCLALDALHRKISRVRRPDTKVNLPPIHVNINGNPLGNTSRPNIEAGSSGPSSSKRARSPSSDGSSDTDEEAVTLTEVLESLDGKYPKLNLLQYMPLFAKEHILYAETILELDKENLAQLGVAEGAIYPLMSGVKKVLSREKKSRKRLRACRERSIEV